MRPYILLGASGGIAAYKIPDLIASLRTRGFSVRVILTQSAVSMLDRSTLRKIGTVPVYHDLFENRIRYDRIHKTRTIEHISLVRGASVFAIVPATANVIAKLAHGLADDYLTTAVLAASCPVLVCPSMNTHMWSHPLTQKNVQLLQQSGYHLFGPDSGMLACGDFGMGRLPKIDGITDEIVRFALKSTTLRGKKILVTSGGTIDPIDQVRYITNKSSGKMGMAIAQSAYLRGADVLLLRSVSAQNPRYPIPQREFTTPESLEKLLQKYAPMYDVCFHAAAVSDFFVKKIYNGKMKSGSPLPLELEPRKKILSKIKSFHPGMYVVGFKAEFRVSGKKLIRLASDRLSDSSCDCIVANEVGRLGRGFQSDANEVWVIPANATPQLLKRNSKTAIAEQLLDMLTPYFPATTV